MKMIMAMMVLHLKNLLYLVWIIWRVGNDCIILTDQTMNQVLKEKRKIGIIKGDNREKAAVNVNM